MLGTLEQFSLLETLKFSYASLFEYDASLEVQPVSRRYALPQLLSIQLEAYALECTNILNHLTLPRITTITLHCLSETGASDLARYLTSKISPQCHPRTLCIRRDFRQLTIHMQGFDAEPSVLVGHGLEGVAVQIDLSYDPSDHVASHTLQTVCEGLPLSEIQDLQVWSLRHPHDWAMLLSRTENVSTLCAYNVNDALPLALCNSVSNNGELESLLPNLRVLKLHEVDFRNCANLHKGLQGRFMSILCTYLMLRYEYGAEVRRLEAKRGINVKETDIQLLKEIVASVSWDGIFKDSEDFYSDNLIQYDDDDAFLW
ncbi:hypothetical protein AcW2_004877 [Taiwanofungus camphoratus]|nr:hypothetical protein AcW2_004877 [Antrodia cinnamomea]